MANGLKNICLAGAQDDTTAYFERASVLLMTSVFEGFGLVLTEAMSRGCIPIAFDCYASLRDIITPDSDGFIVQPFNIDEYVDTLSKIVAMSDTELHALRRAALEKAEKFRVENITRQWLDLLT